MYYKCTCGKEWSGVRMAHCPTCHETFSIVPNFDRHRKNGKCVDPKEVQLRQNDRGTWVGLDERDATEWLHR